jgi:hypothetical protein
VAATSPSINDELSLVSFIRNTPAPVALVTNLTGCRDAKSQDRHEQRKPDSRLRIVGRRLKNILRDIKNDEPGYRERSPRT